MICVIFVDDSIIALPSKEDKDWELHMLGIEQENEENPFDFRDECELSAFFGIKIIYKDRNDYLSTQ